jgi:hypothetical protein
VSRDWLTFKFGGTQAGKSWKSIQSFKAGHRRNLFLAF